MRFERCVPADVAAAAAVYARMLAVEEQSWKGIGECGMTKSPSREFYDYEAKYLDDDSRTEIPAAIDASLVATVQAQSLIAFDATPRIARAAIDTLASVPGRIADRYLPRKD